jgi:hypothetical protein
MSAAASKSYSHKHNLKVIFNDLMIEHGRAAADLRTFTQEVLVSQDDGRPHDTVTVPEVAYAVNFIYLLMMDTECVRNM